MLQRTHPREPPTGGDTPISRETKVLGLRLLEEPHLKVKGQEDREVGWPILPHQHTGPRNGSPYKVGVSRGGEDPTERGALKKGPSANYSRFCQLTRKVRQAASFYRNRTTGLG